MCRMMTAAGSFGQEVVGLYEALVEVCREDPLFPADWKSHPSHDEGWGYVLMNNDYIEHRRYKTPIFESRSPDLPERGLFITHARKAASGEPVGMLDAHPHHRSNTEYDVYLVHNGSYNKANIASALGEGNLGNQPDSEFFLEYLISQKGNIEEKIMKTLEDSDRLDFVKTTNNIFILAVDKTDRKGRIFYYSHAKNPNEYVTLYHVEGAGWNAVVSSSLLKSQKFLENVKVTKVPERTLFELKS